MKTFFADQRWMEDFCASGPVGNAPAAFTNLATLVWNEPAAGKVGLLRNIATAMALNSTAKSSPLGWVRLLAVYHFLSEQGRLHRRSLTQSVREWRFVVCEGRAAVDILWLNYFRNLPHEGYARTYTSVPYRLHNCFGESVHNRRFYEPWWGCPWSMWRIRREVGGVCGALSTFGAQCTNAHGLPATPGGQPGHCIFNRRQLNGRWTIHNYISAPSFAKFNLWGSPFTFLDVVERSFADRERQLVAERCVWLATFVREARKDWPQQETWYRKGAAANPKHYGLWIAWVNALVQSKASAESCHVFLEALVKNLPEGRQATWSVIHQCLQYLVKLPKGQELAVRELEGIYPKLAQTAMPPTREEVDLSSVFSRQLGLIRNPQLRARLITAALAAQPKVNGFYLQLMMAASKSGDVAVFQAAAADYNRRSPIPAKAAQWPIEDFGGRLLSEKGPPANFQRNGRCTINADKCFLVNRS